MPLLITGKTFYLLEICYRGSRILRSAGWWTQSLVTGGALSSLGVSCLWAFPNPVSVASTSWALGSWGFRLLR